MFVVVMLGVIEVVVKLSCVIQCFFEPFEKLEADDGKRVSASAQTIKECNLV